MLPCSAPGTCPLRPGRRSSGNTSPCTPHSLTAIRQTNQPTEPTNPTHLQLTWWWSRRCGGRQRSDRTGCRGQHRACTGRSCRRWRGRRWGWGGTTPAAHPPLSFAQRPLCTHQQCCVVRQSRDTGPAIEVRKQGGLKTDDDDHTERGHTKLYQPPVAVAFIFSTSIMLFV